MSLAFDGDGVMSLGACVSACPPTLSIFTFTSLAYDHTMSLSAAGHLKAVLHSPPVS